MNIATKENNNDIASNQLIKSRGVRSDATPCNYSQMKLTGENLSVTIKKYRKEKGITQDQFATLCDISVRQVAYIEKDFVLPKPDILERIMTALNCSIYYFPNH